MFVYLFLIPFPFVCEMPSQYQMTLITRVSSGADNEINETKLLARSPLQKEGI